MRSLVHEADALLVRTSARVADEVHAGLKASMDPEAIARAFIDDITLEHPPTRDQARAWARLNVLINTRELVKAMDSVYAYGWVIGEAFAGDAIYRARQIRRRIRNKSPLPKVDVGPIDWSKWKPGHEAAAALLKPKGGLDSLLKRGKEVVIKGISQTSRDRIGTILGDAVGLGLTDTTIAKQLIEAGIKGLRDDAERALSIATTEMNRAMSVASMDSYTELGLDRVEWFALEGCDECEANAEDGPIPLGSEFSSGDTEPPAHPNCRCSILPFIEDDSIPVRDVEMDD